MQHRRIHPHVLALAAAALCSQFAYAADTELPMITVQTAAASDPLHGTSSATKLDVPLRDVPQSVQFVDKELIRAQGAVDMKDVLRNVSGVALSQGEGRRDQFYIRGFDATRDTLLDGMRDDSLYFRDLGNVERIEVLKGPAAVLYGRGSAGGVINRVTKKPVKTPVREVTLSGGSENFRRIDLDLGGAAGEQAAFRLTGAYEAGDNYRDVVHSERAVLAPSIAWTAGRDTSFLLQTEFLHQNRTPDRGIPSLNGVPADVPVGNFYGERYDYARTDAQNARFNVEHAVNDKLVLRNNFQYSKLKLDAINTRTLGLAAANTQVRRQITYFPQDQSNFLNQTEAAYQLDAGGVRHALLTGVELGHQKSGRLVRAAATTPVSLQAPQQLMAMPDLAALPVTIDNDFKADTAAWYAQDQASFNEQWKMLAGVRFDRFKQEQNDRRTGLVQSRTDSVWSPRIGVVYQPGQAHALYANLSRSFLPVGNDFFYGGKDFAQIKPVESLQKEIGDKSEWFGGRLQSTVALYEITQRNVATKDPSDPAGVRQVQTGEQQSRGLEVDLTGSLAQDWKVFANATVNHARITQSNNYKVDNRPANIPKHAAGLWSNYELGHGFSIGAGAFYVGDRFAVEDNAVRLPSYVRLDAMLGYKGKNWEAGLNLNNLADKVYYESANNNFQIQPGAPRSVMAYVRVKI
ncbi:TonB-dependent receptor [Pseudoduganella sp. S-14]|uniref:TonB-dependent receptor n=1 Tax=Pseudoduganella sp. S-14 TaxID=3404065 RepID=UPI003CF42788